MPDGLGGAYLVPWISLSLAFLNQLVTWHRLCQSTTLEANTCATIFVASLWSPCWMSHENVDHWPFTFVTFLPATWLLIVAGY